MEKVLLGMSGGVDSSAAAIILKEQGYAVTGITLSLCEQDSSRDIADAKAVCQRLGIEHLTLDLKNEFKTHVIDTFIQQYKQGLTPNPCLECNRHIKFGAMLSFALQNGFDKIATGHYARVESGNGEYYLKKALDQAKDQTYVLYGLTQYELSHLLLPLGDLTKAQIRQKAEEAGLVNANRPDSQDICFVPDGDYAEFIKRTDGFIPQKGNYLDINGNILGQHQGVINYTVGQRKGLGIALGRPQFVISKNAQSNAVVLGDEELLFSREVKVFDVNIISSLDFTGEIRAAVKLRYRHKAEMATLSLKENTATVIFDEPQRAPTPGQAAVFYNGDRVLGGGRII